MSHGMLKQLVEGRKGKNIGHQKSLQSPGFKSFLYHFPNIDFISLHCGFHTCQMGLNHNCHRIKGQNEQQKTQFKYKIRDKVNRTNFQAA